jgi:hypothetical protein
MRKNSLRLAIPQKRIFEAVLCIMALGTAAAGRAEDLADAQLLAQASKVEKMSSAEINRPAAYAIGDKLKITVFEKLQAEMQKVEERRDIVASAIERP